MAAVVYVGAQHPFRAGGLESAVLLHPHSGRMCAGHDCGPVHAPQGGEGLQRNPDPTGGIGHPNRCNLL